MSGSYSWPVLALDPQADLAAVREQARQVGFEEGYRSGAQKAQKEAEQSRQLIQQSLGELELGSRRIEELDERALQALVVDLTRALVGVELATNPAVIGQFVSEAVRHVNTERESVVLKVSAGDMAWLQPLDRVEFLVEDDRPEGSFALETQASSVHFDPIARLEALREVAVEPGEPQS